MRVGGNIGSGKVSVGTWMKKMRGNGEILLLQLQMDGEKNLEKPTALKANF